MTPENPGIDQHCIIHDQKQSNVSEKTNSADRVASENCEELADLCNIPRAATSGAPSSHHETLPPPSNCPHNAILSLHATNAHCRDPLGN